MLRSADHLWVASSANLQVVPPKTKPIAQQMQQQQSPPVTTTLSTSPSSGPREWTLEEYKANYSREMQLRKNLESELQKSRKQTQELEQEVIKLQKELQEQKRATNGRSNSLVLPPNAVKKL